MKMNHLDKAENIHVFNPKTSMLELANGVSFHVPIGNLDIEEAIDFMSSVSIKKGLIAKNDVIVCFYS